MPDSSRASRALPREPLALPATSQAKGLTPPTLVLQWLTLALLGLYTLGAVYGWMPRGYLVVTGWVAFSTGVLAGILHVVLWLTGDLPRPRLFYRDGGMS